MTVLLSCESLGKSYGSRLLFSDISFGVFEGDRIGVIGPNGSGKSTFLKILAGLERADKGNVSSKRSLRIGYVPQESLFADESVEDILLDALKEEDSHLDEYEQYTHVSILLGKLGFVDPSQKVSTLSGGWKKRLALGKALIKSPDILLLDEPTNHLDLEGILWLEGFLSKQSLTYLVISHDRYFLENVTSRIVELDKSYPKGIFSVDGIYSTFLERREDFLSGQAQYERSLNSKVRREIEWLKQNPKARTTKSTARIKEAGQLISELSEVKARNKQVSSQIDFSSTERQTKKLLSAKNVAKSQGGRELFSGVSFTLSPGVRLGILGPNGSGKTTLLKLLAGELQPDMGTIKSVEGLRVVYFDQHREQLSPDISLRRALSPNSDTVTYRGQSIHVNGWAKRFLFSPDRLDLPVGQLSGGERARILIARFMLQPADLLLLDEPTNDLDIQTLELLETSLLDFPGAVVLITHDRFMLDQVSNVILGLGSTSEENLFADYAQWADFQKQLQKASAPKKQDSEKKVPPLSPAKPASKKLSYNEKRELDGMEETILALENEVELLQKRVESPEIGTNAVKLQEACELLHAAQGRLEKLYRRWGELEKQR